MKYTRTLSRTDGKKIRGDFPPSSIVTGTKFSAADCQTAVRARDMKRNEDDFG